LRKITPQPGIEHKTSRLSGASVLKRVEVIKTLTPKVKRSQIHPDVLQDWKLVRRAIWWTWKYIQNHTRNSSTKSFDF